MTEIDTARPPRSAAIDGVRVLAVGAVIVGHAVPDDGFRQYLFAWHVPVFFLLSGYLWREHRTIGDELRARWRTLALPYLFWFVVVGIVYVALLFTGYFAPEPSVDDVVGPLLGGANAREPFTTFWFVTALFFAALLFRLIMPLPEWAKWAVVAIGLASGYLIGPWLAHTPLAIGAALPCLVFLMVGRAARRVIVRIDGRAAVGPSAVDGIPSGQSAVGPGAAGAGAAGSALVGFVLVVGGEALVAAGLVDPPDVKPGYFGTPIAAVAVACAISIGLILVARVVVARVPARVSAVTVSLSYAGLVAVLLHPLFQWLLRPTDAPLWVYIAVMLVVPWSIGIVLRRTGLASVATGAPRAGVS